MKIALYAPDSKMPNYALMKVAQYYKDVEWYTDLFAHTFDKVYISKIFTYSPPVSVLTEKYLIGGSGYNLETELPEEIEACEPDYSLYPWLTEAMGFLTRGCIRRCKDCIVPEKEGDIKPYRDIEQVLQKRKTAILLDNNILACEYGIKQIEKIIRLGVKVDFNQGLDARLIDESIAKLLSKVRWFKPLRMACDYLGMIKPVEKAVKLLRKYNCVPSVYSVYVLVKDIPSALKRVEFLRNLNCDPFAQPYRDKKGTEPPIEQKDFARWVNHKAIFKSTTWDEYVYYRKNRKVLPL